MASISCRFPSSYYIEGHETTATSLCWTLFTLSLDPVAQDKLRSELSASSESPTAEQLDALPYLDMVVKETLRLHPPIENIFREAQTDGIIPLRKPLISKGRTWDVLMLPILALGRMKEMRGENAMEFKPERWDKKKSEEFEKWSWGLGGSFAFGYGRRGCLGARFAVIECVCSNVFIRNFTLSWRRCRIHIPFYSCCISHLPFVFTIYTRVV